MDARGGAGRDFLPRKKSFGEVTCLLRMLDPCSAIKAMRQKSEKACLAVLTSEDCISPISGLHPSEMSLGYAPGG
jgi:hypothetical protein